MNIPEYESYHEDKMHGDASFPYNTYLCSIPLDFTEIPTHWHNEMEIIYIKKGSGSISLDFENFIVNCGDIVIVLPGQLHGISQYEDSKMEYENIIFSIDMLISKHNASLSKEFFIPFLAGNIPFNHHVSPDDKKYPQLSTCLNKADTICTYFPKGYKLAIKGYLFEFLYTIYTYSDESMPQKDNKSLDKLKEVLKFIETNYSHNITIEEISNAVGFSQSHFMKFFKKAMGTSFISYLNDYRLSMAARMLISSDDNIIDIAMECSYDNLSYFNRLFKKKYNVTPSEYRKK